MQQDEFERLLAWLDQDRDRAGEKYETIRRGLIEMCRCRGCWEPEEVADETITRVAGKVKDVAPTYMGDPARYFYGFAKNVLREYHRRTSRPVPVNPIGPADDSEQLHMCLDQCMELLEPEHRELVLEYFNKDKKPGIDHRKSLGQRFKLKPEALRIRIYRIKKTLQPCIDECLSRT